MQTSCSEKAIEELKRAAKIVSTDPADLILYSYDAAKISHRPDCAAFPTSTQEVSELVKVCDAHNIPITPRGAGTGYTGGSVPVNGGLVIALGRMNRLLEINREELYAEVEPGIVNYDFGQMLAKESLFYPPDPASLKSSTIGGNVMTGAGGPSAVKYGVTRDYVMGLTVVMPDGGILETGIKTAKGVVGYDLTRLMVGSEGTLGIVTKIRLRILPLPERVVTAMAVFDERKEAIDAVTAVLGERLTPRTMEFIDRTAIKCVEEYINSGLPVDAGAMLLLETDGSEQSAREEMEKVKSVCTSFAARSFAIAQNSKEADEMWRVRRSISASLPRLRPTKINEDITVPRHRIAELMERLDEISKRSGLPIINFGHAGDGNIHVNVMTDKNDEKEYRLALETIDKILDLTLELDGTLSGEHGIGLVKMPYIAKEIGVYGVEISKKLKHAIDPKNIMNPGKIFR
ncbi:MAG: FAD-binding oxidoreductase [Nitrospinota bacterium]